MILFLAIVAFSFVDLSRQNVIQPAVLIPKEAVENLNDLLQRNNEDSTPGSGVVYKIRKGSCQCVALKGDPCDVEMTEESVLKAKGKACPKSQKYCCTREKHLVNLSKPESTLGHEKGKPLSTSILRDEISNYANVVVASDDAKNPSKFIDKGSDHSHEDDSSPLIRPTVLRAILSFLTEGIKFLTNVFSK